MPRPVLKPGPTHPITIEPTPGRVIVRAGSVVLADSSSALTLRESHYPPVQYLPRAHVRAGLLRPSTTTTYCPYKGEASYHTVETPDGTRIEDAIWVYEDPHPAVEAIAGHLAFYPDRVDVTVIEADHRA